MYGFHKNTPGKNNLETILTQKTVHKCYWYNLTRRLKLSYWILKISGIIIKVNKNFEFKKEIPYSTKLWWAKKLVNLVDC